MNATERALEVLTAIQHQFEGSDKVYAGALLFEDDRSLADHVTEVVRELNQEEAERQLEVAPKIVPRSQRPNIGKNFYGNWVGFIGKRKVKDFGKDEDWARRWLNSEL